MTEHNSSIATFTDNAHPVGDGLLSVRPLFRTKGHRDPFSIFENPDDVRKQITQDALATKILQDTGHIPLGHNLVVNLARQTIANLVGGRDLSTTQPKKDWVVTKASFGTYDEAPRFTDSSLSPQYLEDQFVGGENEIVIDPLAGNKKKAIHATDWPSPYIVRFEIILLEGEANGFLIRELGLWTHNDTLFARKAIVGISKSQDFGLSFLHRVRF